MGLLHCAGVCVCMCVSVGKPQRAQVHKQTQSRAERKVGAEKRLRN